MKANLPDLNNLLFEQLERINDDELSGAELEAQLAKSKAINDIARTIVSNSALILRATQYADDFGENVTSIKLLGSDKE